MSFRLRGFVFCEIGKEEPEGISLPGNLTQSRGMKVSITAGLNEDPAHVAGENNF